MGGGLAYGAQGMTHHATEDSAIMRVLPNITAVVPGDSVETAPATRANIEWQGPRHLRLDKAITVRDGSDVTLIAARGISYNTVQAAEHVAQQGI